MDTDIFFDDHEHWSHETTPSFPECDATEEHSLPDTRALFGNSHVRWMWKNAGFRTAARQEIGFCAYVSVPLERPLAPACFLAAQLVAMIIILYGCIGASYGDIHWQGNDASGNGNYFDPLHWDCDGTGYFDLSGQFVSPWDEWPEIERGFVNGSATTPVTISFPEGCFHQRIYDLDEVRMYSGQVDFDMCGRSVDVSPLLLSDDVELTIRNGEARTGISVFDNAHVSLDAGGGVNAIALYQNSGLHLRSAASSTLSRVSLQDGAVGRVCGNASADVSSLVISDEAEFTIEGGGSLSAKIISLFEHATLTTDEGSSLIAEHVDLWDQISLTLSQSDGDAPSPIRGTWTIENFGVHNDAQLSIHNAVLGPCDFHVDGTASLTLVQVQANQGTEIELFGGTTKITASRIVVDGFWQYDDTECTIEGQSNLIAGTGNGWSTFRLGGKLVLRDGSTLNTNTAGGANFDPYSLGASVIAHEANMTIDGADSAWHVNGPGQLRIDGSLDVHNGGLLHTENCAVGKGVYAQRDPVTYELIIDDDGYTLFVEHRDPAQGAVNVDNSTWQANDLVVGIDGGHGKLTISNGGTVTSQTGIIGTGRGHWVDIEIPQYPGPWEDSLGHVIVKGSSARWIASQNGKALTVGAEGGIGTVEIQEGGSMQCENAFVGVGYWQNPDYPDVWQVSRGTVLVSGDDSRWEVRGNLQVGDPALTRGGIGRVTVAEKARLTVGGTLGIAAGEPAIDEPRGQLTLAGGTVSAELIAVRGSAIEPRTPGRLQGHGQVHIIEPQDESHPHGLINYGEIIVEGDYARNTDLLGSWTDAQFIVRGDYTQGSSGILELTVSNKNLLDDNGFQYVPVSISGTARLDGTLKVNREGLGSAAEFLPEVGQKFLLISYGSVSGRFKTFQGAAIDDERFFGLRYESGALLAYTLETPRLLNGANSHLGEDNAFRGNLVLCTHGWTSNVDDGPMGQLARTMAFEVPDDAWDVTSMDWSDYAGSTADIDPERAASRALDIGESVALWLEDKGAFYDNIHILGHSAGSWLADGIVRLMEEKGICRTSHLTVLDAFTPTRSGIATYGNALPNMGLAADWAEHYVDNRALYGTNATLPGLFTIDVTALSTWSWNPTVWHSWPVQWYEGSVVIPRVYIDLYAFRNVQPGYPLSAEYAFDLPVHEGFLSRGVRMEYVEDGSVRFVVPQTVLQSLFDEDSTIVSDTGTVTFNEDGSVTMATGSPVMITCLLETPDTVDTMSFDFENESVTAGMLSVYFNGDMVFQIPDTSLVPDGVFNSGEFSLGQTYDPGPYTLMFRLDPLTEEQASISLHGSTLLHMVPVPEPSGLVLLAIGAALVFGYSYRLR